MHMTRSNRVLSISAAALAIIGLTAGPALADGSRGHSLLRAPLMGSNPKGPTIAGVVPGGAPWVNAPSNVRVREDGRITVKIQGLVIPTLGTSGPVHSVVAALVCDNMVVVGGSTNAFALSTEGNGSTSDMISVPRHCEDPVVLIKIAGKNAYIASTVGEDD